MNGTQYTERHKNFIREQIKTSNVKELTNNFNCEFKLNISHIAMRGNLARFKIKTGRDTRFVKGCEPFNKGTKGMMKANSGSYKPGHKNTPQAPIGAERKSKSGYIYIKVAQPNQWRLKHRLEIGDCGNTVIRFKNNDKTDCRLDNLEQVTRAEHLIFNKTGYSTAPEAIKQVIKAIAKIETKMQERKNENY